MLKRIALKNCMHLLLFCALQDFTGKVSKIMDARILKVFLDICQKFCG